MAEKRLFTLRGWQFFSPHEETAGSLAEAIIQARWSLDDNSWLVLEIVDPDGEVIMTRADICMQAAALTQEEAYGP